MKKDCFLPAIGRLVADPAAFRGPLGLRDLADRARRRGHDPGVHGRQWPARQGRTVDESDGDEDHLPAGWREHPPAEPSHPRLERGRTRPDTTFGARLWHLAYRTRASTHDPSHRRTHVGARVRHVKPAQGVIGESP